MSSFYIDLSNDRVTVQRCTDIKTLVIQLETTQTCKRYNYNWYE